MKDKEFYLIPTLFLFKEGKFEMLQCLVGIYKLEI